MKFLISYRFTGEDPEKLKPILESIKSGLRAGGHNNYCSFDWQTHFGENKFSNAQILKHSLAELETSDALLAFVNSAEKSEGMLLEIGYALAKKKKIFILVREGVKTVFLEEVADKVVRFTDTKEIPELVKDF